ncbi:pilus assembly protein TadG-related protein [Salinarimonas sp.]|uniref:pilus assembly protein TadG-related protein n=1 Tax=Salinarimonas sp. TaxID=2766526 RepID=UPI0032D8EF4F
MFETFRKDRRGAVGVALGLAIVPVIAMAGAAVDYSRVNGARAQAQALVDAAALAAISRETTFARKTAAEEFVEARLGDLSGGTTLVAVRPTDVVDPETGAPRLRVEADLRMRTSFAGLIGVEEIDFTVESEVTTSDKSYEIVLVVDVTGSMKGSKMRALRDSARRFVETLLPEGRTDDRIRVGMVPYSSAVNIGRARQDWLGPAPGGLSAIVENRYVFSGDEVPKPHCRGTNVTWDADLELCYIGELHEWTAAGACPGVEVDGACHVADGWAGCVMERYRTDYELTADTPATEPFRPFYWPSWRGLGGGSARFNSYLPGPIDEEWNTNASSNNGRGPNLGCPKNEIIAFTNDRRRLVDEIDDFEAWHRGGTLGHIGMLWGWRMLSWQGLWGDEGWPHAFDRGETEKIVVFMTDGENNFFSGMAPAGDSDFTAYGRLSDTDGLTRSNNRDALDDKMQTVCAAMRAQGIEIFTVGFALNSNSAHSLLKGCATSPAHVFRSEVKTLVSHFETIANDIADRRIAISR